jgi:hypothetical protein
VSSHGRTPSSLDELKHFLEFLQNLWATLAGVSVLFPLSTALSRTIPVAKWSDGGFGYFSPAIVAGTASLVCVFVTIWTFGQREQNRRDGQFDPGKRALRLFGLGIVSLVVYLAGHYSVTHDFYFRVLGWETDDLRWLVGDVVLLIAYVGFFACVTRAFVVLGLREYLKSGAET